jgi:uncharacterized protein (DUF58 family)
MLDQQSLLRSVRHIEIRTDRMSDDFFAGGYHSVFKGLGLEFSEVRPYTVGDDVRSIDWNVTARTGTPHVKSFVEERELTVVLIVDASGSLDFGSQERTKAEAAAEVCALLAFSAIKNNDKVGLITFTDQVELFLPPRKGRHQVLRVIREVLGPQRRHRHTDISAAVEFATRTLTRRSVMFVISDFRDSGYLDALTIAHRRHDVIAVDLYDPREHDLGSAGLIDLEDAETGRRVLVDTTTGTFKHVHKMIEQRRAEERRAKFLSHGIDLVSISTATSPVDPLVQFFDKRRRRLRR